MNYFKLKEEVAAAAAKLAVRQAQQAIERNRRPGAHGQLQASMAERGLWNAGASGDVARGKLGVHGNLALRHDGTEKIRASRVDWNNPVTGQTGQTTQASQVFVRRTVASVALGADYALSDTESVSLATRYNRRQSRPWFDVLNTERENGRDTVYHRISHGPNQQSDTSASLAYSRQHQGAAVKAMFQHSGTTAPTRPRARTWNSRSPRWPVSIATF